MSKKKNNITTTIVFAILGFVIAYLLVSFIALDFNVLNWSVAWRGMLVCWCIIITGMSSMNDDKN